MNGLTRRKARLEIAAVFVFLAVGLILSAPLDPVLAKNTTRVELQNRIPDALIEPGSGQDRIILIVEKTTQRLFVYEFKNGNYYLIDSMVCSTGENKGDKRLQGDKKTPEGFYFFNKKSLKHELGELYGVLAYPMDYPNFWDKREGKNGHGIWMHGINKKMAPLNSNGCIELTNLDIIEIEPKVSLFDTPVIIYDEVKYKGLEEINREATRIKAFLESWRCAWADKNFEAYKAKYALDFTNSDDKTYKAWMDHNVGLNKKYKSIHIELRHLQIFRHRNVILVLFDQYYRGDDFVRNGQKRLYLRAKGEGYEIAAEEWREFPPKQPLKMLSAEVKRRVFEEAGLQPAVVASAPAPEKPRPTPATEVKVEKPGPVDSQDVEAAITAWLEAWRRKDIEDYLTHYHPEFRYRNMDLHGFKNYKAGLAEKYKSITITVDKMKVKLKGREALVTFLQDYRSDTYRDYGLKTLVLLKQGNDWRIRSETWSDMSGGAKP